MDGALGRGALPSLNINGAKEVLLGAAPNPPSRSSIWRVDSEDVWGGSEARKRFLLANIAASSLELSFSSGGSRGDEDANWQNSKCVGREY